MRKRCGATSRKRTVLRLSYKPSRAPRKTGAQRLAAVAKEWYPGTSYLIYDEATEKKAISQNMIQAMFVFMNQAEKELLITNAYIIPGQPAIDFVQQLTDRGVKTRILTTRWPLMMYLPSTAITSTGAMTSSMPARNSMNYVLMRKSRPSWTCHLHS